LQSLSLRDNKIATLPEWLGDLAQLRELDLYSNDLTSLPASLAKLTNIETLRISDNIGELPEWIRHFRKLDVLWLEGCGLRKVPDWIGDLTELSYLTLYDNKLEELPNSIARLERLKKFSINKNPLNPELAAANKEGIEAVKRYLRAKAEAQVALNEAKLILIGEGEVGKSSLLAALRDEPWIEGNPTTHGIEIKPVKITSPDKHTEITLNGWDFGGQRVYSTTRIAAAMFGEGLNCRAHHFADLQRADRTVFGGSRQNSSPPWRPQSLWNRRLLMEFVSDFGTAD